MAQQKVSAFSRLKQDYLRLKRDPLPYITAEPLPSNMLEWHYVVKGPEDSPFSGGYYHGTLHFPNEFPFMPPSIKMLTPNGRFQVGTRLCLTISDFHPETWNPTWWVGGILTGLLSFMLKWWCCAVLDCFKFVHLSSVWLLLWDSGKMSSTAVKKVSASSRLQQDYLRLKRDPLPYITAEPLPSNMLEWHYVLKGPENSPYAGGYYHGILRFPKQYPFMPPAIYMLTPNCSFVIGTPICLNISNHHPESWNPTWWVGGILNGLLSFMLDGERNLVREKQRSARDSLEFNLQNPIFRDLFPDICNEIRQKRNS